MYRTLCFLYYSYAAGYLNRYIAQCIHLIVNKDLKVHASFLCSVSNPFDRCIDPKCYSYIMFFIVMFYFIIYVTLWDKISRMSQFVHMELHISVLRPHPVLQMVKTRSQYHVCFQSY